MYLKLKVLSSKRADKSTFTQGQTQSLLLHSNRQLGNEISVLSPLSKTLCSSEEEHLVTMSSKLSQKYDLQIQKSWG